MNRLQYHLIRSECILFTCEQMKDQESPKKAQALLADHSFIFAAYPYLTHNTAGWVQEIVADGYKKEALGVYLSHFNLATVPPP